MVQFSWIMSHCFMMRNDKYVSERPCVINGIVHDWNLSLIVNYYKGKGDALDCRSYRCLMMLDHVLIIAE